MSHAASSERRMSLTPNSCRAWLPAVIDIADAAGREIMRIYAGRLRRDAQGRSLAADRGRPGSAAHHRRRACGAHARIAMLGEESPPAGVRAAPGWQTLWLVDPLDGTREFVKRNGEFTRQYRTGRGRRAGARRGVRARHGRCCTPPRAAAAPSAATPTAARTPIHVTPRHPRRCACSAVARTAMRCSTACSSGSGPHERISLGSALKFGLLAEGSGDLYVRRGPTSRVGHGGRARGGARGRRLRGGLQRRSRCATTRATPRSIPRSSPTPTARATGSRIARAGS